MKKATNESPPRPRRSLGEWWRLRRRWIVAAAVFAAVFAGLRAVAPDGGDAATVIAPAADLPLGHVITEQDLTTVRLTGRARADPDLAQDAVGRVLAVAWPAGVPLHRRALAGSDLTRGLPRGTVAVGLSLGQGSPTGFLRTGDAVDVVVTADDEDGTARPSTVATGAKVLWVSGREEEGGWLGGSGGDDDAAAIVVAVPRASAPEVSSAPQRGIISLVVTG